jgi:Nitrogen regulatory protein PII
MADEVKSINGEQVTVIVNHGVGSKVFKIIKNHGVLGGIVYVAKGTIKNKLLEFFEIADIRKEVVMFAGPSEVCRAALKDLYESLHLEKPHHGIAFSEALTGVYSSKGTFLSTESDKQKSEEATMYTKIMTTVDKGNAEVVVDAAVAAGARGGTIINARGSGINQTSTLFSMEIEPEKEIAMILVKDEIAEAVVEAIRAAIKIDEPGNGIIFTQKVLNTYGIFES